MTCSCMHQIRGEDRGRPGPDRRATQAGRRNSHRDPQETRRSRGVHASDYITVRSRLSKISISSRVQLDRLQDLIRRRAVQGRAMVMRMACRRLNERAHHGAVSSSLPRREPWARIYLSGLSPNSSCQTVAKLVEFCSSSTLSSRSSRSTVQVCTSLRMHVRMLLCFGCSARGRCCA